MKTKIFSTNIHSTVDMNGITIKKLIIGQKDVETIKEYCLELGYKTNVAKDITLPTISLNKKKVFVQRNDNNELIVVNTIPVFDDDMNIIDHIMVEENLSEKMVSLSLVRLVENGKISNRHIPANIYQNNKIDLKKICGIQYFYSSFNPYKAVFS